MPKIETPKIDVPKAEAPKFAVPSTPSYNFDTPVPSKPVETAPSVPLEPQEVRDDRAREAKATYKGLYDEAKELEKKAQEAANKAKEAKKVAKEAKDAACETRTGGKILCIRPFGIGY